MLSSAVLVGLFKSVDSDVSDDWSWKLLESKVCALLLLESTVSNLNNNHKFTEQGRFPDVNIEA